MANFKISDKANIALGSLDSGHEVLLDTGSDYNALTLAVLLDWIEANAVLTASSVDTAGAVMNTDYNANTILAADTDDTPTTLSVPEQRLVGRITGGTIDALTAGEVRTLLNVEDGATADMTANEILTALIGVDGSGSLLDGDLLDGQHGSYYSDIPARLGYIPVD